MVATVDGCPESLQPGVLEALTWRAGSVHSLLSSEAVLLASVPFVNTGLPCVAGVHGHAFIYHNGMESWMSAVSVPDQWSHVCVARRRTCLPLFVAFGVSFWFSILTWCAGSVHSHCARPCELQLCAPGFSVVHKHRSAVCGYDQWPRVRLP